MATGEPVDAGKLWAAGVATAAIGAGAAVVVYLFANGVFETDLFVPESPGSSTYEELGVAQVILVSFVAGLVATGVLHLFLLFVPSPTQFFAALATVVIAASLLVPFTLDIPSDLGVPPDRIRWWLAGLHVAVGLVDVGLLLGVVPRVLKPAPVRRDW